MNKLVNIFYKLNSNFLEIRYNYILNLPKRYIHNALDFYCEEIKNSFEFFKKFFKNAIFLDYPDIIDVVLNIAKSLNINKRYYLKFGIFQGKSINFISKSFPGWSVGEFKSFKKVFKENEFVYTAFGLRSEHVLVKYKKVKSNRLR